MDNLLTVCFPDVGNMWAQTWGNIFPMVEPFKDKRAIDVTNALQRQVVHKLIAHFLQCQP